MQSIKDMIHTKMIELVTADLTSARADQELSELTQEQINKIITQYEPKIMMATNNMYDAYNENNTLDDLNNPEADWFCDFLYGVFPNDYFLSELKDEDQENTYKEFNIIIQKMIDKRYDLPADFKLYYTIMEHGDRKGSVIHISPYLTKTAAERKSGKNENESGKYGFHVTNKIIDSETQVSLENYDTYNERKCEADYKINNNW